MKEDHDEMSLILFFQDDRYKMQSERLKLTLDISFLRGKCQSEKDFQRKSMFFFYEWADSLKRALRPIWVDPEIMTCFICDLEFTYINR